MIMKNTTLKLILCWALVNKGFSLEDPIILNEVDEVDDVADVANVNFYCSTPGRVFKGDCKEEIGDGGLTPDDLIMDIFNRCVFQTTGTNLDFDLPDFEFARRKRALSTAEIEGANDEAGRSLGICDACTCAEICCIKGYCGSSCRCTCACQRRRLEEEDEILSILQGRQLTTEATLEVEAAVQASCTAQVRTLAILLRSFGNFCLGDGVVAEVEVLTDGTDQVTYLREEIACTTAVISTNQR
jgi:hypothetical protein